MRDHTSLLAWQRAALVAEACVPLNRGYWKRELSSLFYQLSAASLSVRLNIAEGYALGRPALQQRHYRIAYGSINETIELLDMLGKVADHIPPTTLPENPPGGHGYQRAFAWIDEKNGQNSEKREE